MLAAERNQTADYIIGAETFSPALPAHPVGTARDLVEAGLVQFQEALQADPV